MNFSRSFGVNRFLITALAAGAAIFVIFYFSDYNHMFVHPHCVEVHLKFLAPDGAAFHWSDWIKPFARIDGAEDRPRFLSYLFALVDYHLKLAGYDHFVWFPTLSVTWIFTLGLAPWLLFKAVKNLGMGAEAAVVAVILYMTSTGCLFDLGMMFFSAKSLTNAAFIFCLYLVSRLRLENKQGLLLYEIKSPLKNILFWTMFTALFLDEGPLFLFVFLPVMFWELFIVPSLKSHDLWRMAKNAFWFLAPFFLFLVAVLWIVPMITGHFFDYHFDYIGTLLAKRQEQIALGKTMFSRGAEGFGPQSFIDNLANLFGMSLVPEKFSPLILHNATSGVLSGQTHNTAQLLILLATGAGAITLIFRADAPRRNLWARTGILCVLYTLFMSALMGRHIIYFTGYYYGCTFAVFWAMFAAFCFEELKNASGRFGLISVFLLSWIILVQLSNFTVVNQSHVYFHNEEWSKNIFRHDFPIADNKPLSRDELCQIRKAWKEKRILQYLRQNPVSSGAVYLLAELRHIDRVAHSSENRT